MTLKAYLIAAALGGTVIAGAAVMMMPGPSALAQSKPAGEGLLTDQQVEESFLGITPPEPTAENAALVPHATPEEAAAIAADFFARPAPSDAELEAMAPFAGTENSPVQHCAAFTPKAAKEELILAPANANRRMKWEIAARLAVNQVLGTGDCTCRGKTPPWEPVALILDEVKKRHGEPTGLLFGEYTKETNRLTQAVERLCRGRF